MIDQSHVDEKETEEKEVERVTGWAKKPVYSTGPYPSVPRHYNSENRTADVRQNGRPHCHARKMRDVADRAP